MTISRAGLGALLALASLAAAPAGAETLEEAASAARESVRAIRAFSTPLSPYEAMQIRRASAFFLHDWLVKAPAVDPDLLQGYLAADARSFARDLARGPGVGAECGSVELAPESGPRLRAEGVRVLNDPAADRFAVVAPGKTYMLTTPGWGPENLASMEAQGLIPRGEPFAVVAFRLKGRACDLEEQLVWVRREGGWRLFSVLDVF